MAIAEYNFFKLNLSGVVDSADVLKLADDRSALAHAREMYHSQPVEIWTGRRRIGLIPASADRRAVERRAH